MEIVLTMGDIQMIIKLVNSTILTNTIKVTSYNQDNSEL